MEQLQSIGGLTVSQKKEWGEILSGFETKNKYVVLDETGRELYLAMEKGGSFFLRTFLKALRPFEIVIMSHDGQVVLRIKRPFRFYFHEVEVLDAHGRVLGTIKRRFACLHRHYAVMDENGRKIYELFGPLLHPWTFEIRQDEVELGKITKRWSGLVKEACTDADNFGMTFPHDWAVETKALLLGAVFLIDFVYFENTGKNR